MFFSGVAKNLRNLLEKEAIKYEHFNHPFLHLSN